MAANLDGQGGRAPRPTPRASSGGETLERSLSGSLPCIGCGYELQGLSVRGQCPECGLLVRATILWRVDPHAEAFTPLTTPRLTALGVFLWSLGAFIAAIFAWWPRLVDVLREMWGVGHTPSWTGMAVVMGAGVSCVGALALIKPTRDAKREHIFWALLGVCAYAPLMWLLTYFYAVVSPRVFSPYIRSAVAEERVVTRLLIAACALVILLGMRPNARRLVARSLVLRTGRVDRQTILASVGAVSLAALGDLVRLASTWDIAPTGAMDVIAWVGTVMVLLGSMLMTGALGGAVIDSWRIRRAILSPSPSIRQVMGESPGID